MSEVVRIIHLVKYVQIAVRLGCFFKKLILLFSFYLIIKLIKSDNNDMYNAAKDIYVK